MSLLYCTIKENVAWMHRKMWHGCGRMHRKLNENQVQIKIKFNWSSFNCRFLYSKIFKLKILSPQLSTEKMIKKNCTDCAYRIGYLAKKKNGVNNRIWFMSFSQVPEDLLRQCRYLRDPRLDSRELCRCTGNVIRHHSEPLFEQSCLLKHIFDRRPNQFSKRSRWMLCSNCTCNRQTRSSCSPTERRDDNCANLRQTQPTRPVNSRLGLCLCKREMWNQTSILNTSFNQLYSLVVRTRAIHVCYAVHEERNVQHDGESQNEIHPKRRKETFVPSIVRHKHWHRNSEQCKQWFVQSLLPHNNRICVQVAQIDDLPLGHNLWMRRQK